MFGFLGEGKWPSVGSLALPPAEELSQWRFEAWREAATTVVAMQRPWGSGSWRKGSDPPTSRRKEGKRNSHTSGELVESFCN